MSEAKRNGESAALAHGVVIGLDFAIPFDFGVDCLFHSTMLLASATYWQAQNKPVDIPSAEALRRAIALMEAIFTGEVTIKESR